MVRIIAALLLLTSTASAQVSRISGTYQRCQPGYCQIEGTGGTAVNIGKFPDGSCLFVSAGHLFGHELQDNNTWQNYGVSTQSINMKVYIGDDDDAHDAEFLGYHLDDGTDVSFWKVSCTADRHRDHLRSYCVSTDRVPSGRAALISGFSKGNPTPRPCTTYQYPSHLGIGNRWLYSDHVTEPGDSGGPLFVNDRIVGIVSGGTLPEHAPAKGRYTPSTVIVSIVQKFYPSAQLCTARLGSEPQQIPVQPTQPIAEPAPVVDPNAKWATVEQLDKVDAQTKRNKLRIDAIQRELKDAKPELLRTVTETMITVLEKYEGEVQAQGTEIRTLREQLDQLKKQVAEIESTPGPAGSQGASGQRGPQGPIGPQGPQGDSVTIDTDELRAIVEQVIRDKSIRGKVRVRVNPAK